ncbi:acyl carrier protein, partial [Burkholderia pseudomallei]
AAASGAPRVEAIPPAAVAPAAFDAATAAPPGTAAAAATAVPADGRSALAHASSPVASPPQPGDAPALERMHAYLRDKLSQVLKLPPERIEPDASFASYGVDSIMAMALITALEKELGSLPKTLFFEHETIEELGAYLLERCEPMPSGVEPATVGADDRAAYSGARPHAWPASPTEPDEPTEPTASPVSSAPPAASPPQPGDAPALERMHAYLRDKLSQVLKLPPERIETDASFASYGVDSIMAMALIAALEKELGSLPKTLFFEHETIEELGAYLLERCEPMPSGVEPATVGADDRAAYSGARPHAWPASPTEPDEPTEPTASPASSAPPAASPPQPGDAPALERMHAYLRDKLSQVLKLPPERIETDASFASYGVDSIMAMALITALEKELGSLPKTLFFEHETIEELGEYLLERQGQERACHASNV